jgi:hypothetical protein
MNLRISPVFFAAPAAFFLTCLGALAQSGIGHSPVSRLGSGLLMDFGISRNEAMGGCGQAVPDEDFPNFSNPALLHFNRKVNLNMDFRYLYRRLSQTGENLYRRGAAGPANLSILVPISGRISAGMGIRPYSFREYVYENIRYASTDSIGLRLRGSGGLSQAYFAAGMRITKNLGFGIEGSYVFGTMEDSVTFGVLPSSVNYLFSNIVKRKASQFMFRPGLHFVKPLIRNKPVFLSLGCSADLVQQIALSRYNQFAVPGTNFRDTLEYEVPSGIRKPRIIRAGIGIYSLASWSVNAEAEYQQADFIPADGAVNFSNSLSWRGGAEFRPGTNRSTAYLNLITYRAGLSIQNQPFSDSKGVYRDLRFSAGASFPIIRKEAKFTRPLINLSVAAGRRGNQGGIFGREDYWQIHLGFTLNDFMWFNRYKVD